MAHERKTVLVASRHPNLADVRKRVLEDAGYRVIATGDPEQVEEGCRRNQVDLILIGYSLTAAEKTRIALEARGWCKCPILVLWHGEPQERHEEGIRHEHARSAEEFLEAVRALLDPPQERYG